MPTKTSLSSSKTRGGDSSVLGRMWDRSSGGPSVEDESGTFSLDLAGNTAANVLGRDVGLSQWTEAQTIHLRKELVSKHEASLRRLRTELQERFEEQISFERERLTEAHEAALEQQRAALLKLHDDRIERRYIAMVHESEEELWGEYESRLQHQRTEFQKTLREERSTVRKDVRFIFISLYCMTEYSTI